ncbi:MAG: DUF4058 family protein [Planctomycetales bacterium]
MIAPPNELLARIESARLWNFFHKDWLLQMRLALRGQLPGEYRVFVESEAVLVTPDGADAPAGVFVPDVSAGRSASLPPEGGGFPRGAATTAVVEADETCAIETHYTLVVRHSRDQRIVAVVELLSPSNKGLGNRLDREQHLRKRDRYLDAGINLLEIDSLLEGVRDLPPAIAALKDYERVAWTASHDDGRRRYRGWGWNARDPLPAIDWRIDPGRAVLIDLSVTLRDAVAFNDWESLAR